MTPDEKHETRPGVKESAADPIVQYILVRTDLNWCTGATIAQACHASCASIYKTLGHKPTTDYLTDLESMHKIVLKVDKLDDLLEVEEKLKRAQIKYHLWIEKPENIPTSLAVSPQHKSCVQGILKHLKLYR